MEIQFKREQVRFIDNNGNTHVIDRGGNYKVGRRIMNPKEPEYSDDRVKLNGEFISPFQAHILGVPMLATAYPPVPAKPKLVRKTGRMESFVYFDQDLHKTVKMELIDGEYKQTIL